MDQMKLHINGMTIASYEVGNLNKWKNNHALRPVCALMLTDNNKNHMPVKVIFKGDFAVNVHKYITSRKKTFNITDEKVTCNVAFRELRSNCIVANAIENITVNASIEV